MSILYSGNPLGIPMTGEKAFIQPILSTNITGYFDVWGSSLWWSGRTDFWYAFDGQSNTSWLSSADESQYIAWMTSCATRLKKIAVTTPSGGAGISEGKVWGSQNRGQTYIELNHFYNSKTGQGETWEIAVNAKEFCTHYKLETIKSAYSANYGRPTIIAEIKLDAVTQAEFLYFRESYMFYGKLVGSLTNNNGFISGFSTSSYFILPESFSQGNKPWEWVFRFSLATVGTSQKIYSQGKPYPSGIEINSNKKVVLLLSNSNSSFDIGIIEGKTTLNVNTAYWVKATFDGSKYSLYLSMDGENYVLEGILNSSIPLNYTPNWQIGVDAKDGSPFSGSINFNESYIKVGGKYWWKYQ